MATSCHTLAEINSLPQAEFVRIVGPVFEHSPWVAEVTWKNRPFATRADLHQALCRIMNQADEDRQLALIRAHPDLVGRAARAGALTPASTAEQANAGLNRLTPREIELFENYNRAYREKFDFPFVICARLNKKAAILAGFELRLKNSRAEEIAAALAEIGKIADLRLQDLVEGPQK